MFKISYATIQQANIFLRMLVKQSIKHMCLLRRYELIDKLSYTKRQLRDQFTNSIINNIDVVSDTGAFTQKIILDHCSSSVL